VVTVGLTVSGRDLVGRVAGWRERDLARISGQLPPAGRAGRQRIAPAPKCRGRGLRDGLPHPRARMTVRRRNGDRGSALDGQVRRGMSAHGACLTAGRGSGTGPAV
jgi:hypothetical protein